MYLTYLMDKVEILILRNLLYNEEYLRKVIPFIKAEYFEDPHQKVVFEEILNFVNEYNQPTTKEVLHIISLPALIQLFLFQCHHLNLMNFLERDQTIQSSLMLNHKF